MTTDRHEEFLLLRMLPEQVSDKWEWFAPVLELSLPPTVVDRRLRMANVLRSILLDELIVWVYQSRDGEVLYVTSTIIRVDPVSLTKDLLVYSFTGIGGVRPFQLKDGFGKISKYAKTNNCEGIIAYVDDDRIKNFLKSVGAKTNFTLIQLEV